MRIPLDFGKNGITEVDMPNTSLESYQLIRNFLESALADPSAKNREIIAQAFEMAAIHCPEENLSDLWHHVIYRIYKQVASNTNPEQSWVRTSGEGFEIAIARMYNPLLSPYGIRLLPLISKIDKQTALSRMNLVDYLGSSKIDVLVEKRNAGKEISDNGFGIVGGLHCKVSLAERVSDDIPASRIMMARGYQSILITLDVKSFPPPHGDLVNRGELGSLVRPSDKRKYVEVHGDFSACFSFNQRSIPSGAATDSGRRIYVVNSISENDHFIEYLRDNI